MIKYYCDRCGKELDRAVGQDVSFRFAPHQHIRFTGLEFKGHLCEECYKGFNDIFMKNYDPEEEDLDVGQQMD